MAISGGDGSIILTTKVDETGLKKGLGSMKKLGATAGKAFLAIGAAAATATVAITKMAVSAYADYEQLVGGVETLFKGSAQKVIDYANDAFYTAGVSANEYMQQVTSFSASLIRSTAGDTDKAADIANMALIDISDNVNKMGSSMESVTLAYQGFAKQQYMLLDNLKLGYGGTKTEMERLLKDAQALTGVKYDINNLADVYSAIHAIQEELGITGTTAKEAEKTITGSANMMKAAWQNVLSAIAGGGDLDRAINNLVYSVQKYFENIVPVVERSLIGIGRLIEQVAPMLVQNVANALIRSIPSLVNAVYQMIIGLAKGIWQGIKSLFTGNTNSVTADIKTSVGGIATSAGEASSGIEELGNATEKAGKKAKKTVAAFDELTIITSNSDGGSSDVAGAGTPTASIGGVGGGFDGFDLGAKQIETEISALMATIMLIVGDALLAIGVILLCAGQIPLGIGAIVAGLISMGVGTYALQDQISPQVKAVITAIMLVIGAALIAIGIILICTGAGIPLGIGLIVAGAADLVSAVAINWNWIGPMISKIIDTVKNSILLSAGVVVLGVLLVLAGGLNPAFLGLGLGLLVLGLGFMGYQILSPHWDFIKEKVGYIWNSLVEIWNTKIYPGLQEVQNAWNKMYEEHLKPVIDKLWKVVLEPFLTWVKETFSIGLKNRIAIAADLIVLSFKLIGENVLDLITIMTNLIGFIDNVFSGDWEAAWRNIANIFKTIFEDIGIILKGTINTLINYLNKMIGDINKIKFDVPEWVPVIGGKKWGGFDIPKIPRLAQGAVIPPNREFLAVLGDQKHGTNIEAPAELIKQMAMEAMLEVGATGQTTKEEHYYLGETELMTILHKLVKGGERLQGPSLISGGAY